MTSSRQLAAIMFTDIAGYTRLMGEDEQKAMQVLRKNRKIHQSIIKKYHGNWLKEMGDGTLASFKTTSDAVFCAGALIKACEEEDIKLRIGIHQGEVIEENGDIFGDGVNIASRLEPLADPGQILVSGPIHRNIKNKQGISSSFLKEVELKNVDEPVKVYQLSVDLTKVDFEEDKRIVWINKKSALLVVGIALVFLIGYSLSDYLQINNSESLPEIEKSIAVLPFKSLSDDPEKQYLADGVMDAILLHLSRIKDLRVISRTTTEKYRDQTKTMSEIASELNVTYILEGSFQKYGDKAKLTVQLIKPGREGHMWANEYDRNWIDIFTVQSEVAKTIARELQAVITPEEKQLIEKIPTANLEAYEHYLKGNEYQQKYYKIDTAILFYKMAIALDPEFAQAYLKLGESFHKKTYWSEYFKETFADSLIIYADMALKINPYLADGYGLRGYYYYLKSDFDKSIEQYEKALEINPIDGDYYIALGKNYKAQGNYHKTIANHERAKGLLRGEPGYNSAVGSILSFYRQICDFDKVEQISKELYRDDSLGIYGTKIFLHFLKGEWEELEFYSRKNCKIDSGGFCFRGLAWSFMYRDKFAEALKYFEKEREAAKKAGRPLLTSEFRYAYTLYNVGRKEEARKHFDLQIEYCKERIRLKRHDATISAIAQSDLAQAYAFLGEKEKAYKLLHEMESKEFQGWQFAFCKVNQIIKNLWEDEEFKQIIQRQEKKYAYIRAEIDKIREEGWL